MKSLDIFYEVCHTYLRNVGSYWYRFTITVRQSTSWLVIWTRKKKTEKSNANLNRLQNVNFSFEVNPEEVEFAVAA